MLFLIIGITARRYQDTQRCTECRSQSSDQPQQPGTSHSSQGPACKTPPSTMSLESNNLIMVPGLCRGAHPAHSQLPRTVCGEHGTGTGSGQQAHNPSILLPNHTSSLSLYRRALPSQPKLCQHSPGFSIQTPPCSTHVLSAQDTTPCAACGGTDPSQAGLR